MCVGVHRCGFTCVGCMCVGVYRCVGIPGWAGMGTHVCAHTFMYQHMHVEVKEVLGEAPRGSFIFSLHRISLE